LGELFFFPRNILITGTPRGKKEFYAQCKFYLKVWKVEGLVVMTFRVDVHTEMLHGKVKKMKGRENIIGVMD